MGAIGVDARLKPGPGIHQIAVGIALCNFLDHGVGGMAGNELFRNTLRQSLHTSLPSDVCDLSAIPDQFDFFLTLDHPLLHHRFRDISKIRLRQDEF